MKDLAVFKNYFLIVTVTGNFIAVLESSTVNVALYEIAKSFNISLNEVQLVTSAYILIFTIFLPLFGKLSDLVNRSKLYACGFLIFGLGAFLNTIAQNLPMLLASRGIEALGGSILISNSAALITLMFKGNKRGRALGIVGASVALGGISGPAVSGALIQFFGWHTIFIPSILIGIIGIFCSLKYIPSFKTQKKDFSIKKIDLIGFCYFAVALSSLFLILACHKNCSFVNENIFYISLISIIFWYLFHKHELSVKDPLINLALFKNKTFTFGCIALILWFVTAYTHCLLFPFVIQEVLNFSPLLTGLLMLPFSIMVMIMAPISGKYEGNHPNSLITTVGTLIYTIGFSILLCIKPGISIIVLLFSSLIMGIGNGMFQSPLNTVLMSSVEKKDIGTASGLLSLSRNSGMIVGIAFSLGIFDFIKTFLLNLKDEYTFACLTAFKLVIISCLILLLIISIILFMGHCAAKQS